MEYSVGAIARAAGVTVRTLHHYDEIGLLTPSGRSAAGYREYASADLLRLQRVLGYRALGLPLDEIAVILDDPTIDPVEHLRTLHVQLGDHVARLQAQLLAIEKTMEAYKMGIELTPEEMFEVFGDHDPTEHAVEAEQRWGDNDAYQQSRRRTSAYRKEDWRRMQTEAATVEAGLVAAYRSGVPASGEAAMAAAEVHRQHISAWFYDCGYDVHRGLAQMYVEDPRFTAHYEQLAEGLATYVHDAIVANADRVEAADRADIAD
jgi:DNA-binding transcriptional MerR regulator